MSSDEVKAVFAELARASEGVMRDLINIFTLSYFNAHRRDRDKIDKRRFRVCKAMV
jgi:hypothetical protein